MNLNFKVLSSNCKVIQYFAISNKKNIFCIFLYLIGVLTAPAQVLNARFLAYIDTYKDIAIEQCNLHGIPPSITLAQGLLESNAGNSYLATRGNNHFGIKCYHWTGDVVEYDDTLKHDCYRKYGSPRDSFEDHSRFLSTKRYRPLHALDSTDYQGWATGLLTCGYAEDPAYPQKLIALIQQYNLQQYDTIATSHTVTTQSQATRKPVRERTTNKPQTQTKPQPAPAPTTKQTNTPPVSTKQPEGNKNAEAKKTEQAHKKSNKRLRNSRTPATTTPLNGTPDNDD